MIKISVDAVMTLALIALMGYMVTGDLAHEIIGTVMIVLWVVHNILNRKWYSSLARGTYSSRRIINTVINILLFISVAGLIVSSVILSSFVFSFLGIESGLGFARELHMVSSYWCFVLSSLHLGLHWGRIVTLLPEPLTILPRILVMVLAGYGVYAFIKQQIASYMFMRTMFVFFDFEQSPASFFFEYVCIMVLFGTIAYYALKLRLRQGRAGRGLCESYREG